MPKLAHEYTFLVHFETQQSSLQIYPFDFKYKSYHIFLGEAPTNIGHNIMCFIKSKTPKSKLTIVKILAENNIQCRLPFPYIGRVYWLADMYQSCKSKMPLVIKTHIKMKTHYSSNVSASFKESALSLYNENDDYITLKARMRHIGFLLLSKHKKYLISLIKQKEQKIVVI
jgi:hypothetical protein